MALLLSVPLLMMGPRRVGAQVVATSFEELQALVKRGDSIYVTDASGRKSKGRLGELSSSSLELLVRKTGPGGRETFVPQAHLSEGDVRQIVIERPDSLWNGTLTGLAVVGGPWALICSRGCYYNEYGAEDLIRRVALITTAIGAGAGALIDASMRQRSLVYYHAPSQRSASAHVAPFLSKSGGGIQMSVRF